MKFAPENISDFYNQTDNSILLQGDIIASKDIGFKDDNSEFSPDFWMIITKNCDLVISDGVTRRGNVSIVPILKLSLLSKLFKKNINAGVHLSGLKKVVLIPLVDIFTISKINKEFISNIISEKVSKFSFLPPDGVILKNPHVIDFELIKQLNASDPNILTQILSGKKLQLASPFRERIAQKFALHYSSIGINDDFIKTGDYKKLILDDIKK